jgi:hypothetical protein
VPCCAFSHDNVVSLLDTINADRGQAKYRPVTESILRLNALRICARTNPPLRGGVSRHQEKDARNVVALFLQPVALSPEVIFVTVRHRGHCP